MGQLQELKAKNAELEVEFKTTCEVNAELRTTLSEAEGIYIGIHFFYDTFDCIQFDH